MQRFNMKYLIPAVMACAVVVAAPTGAQAKFLFFGSDRVVNAPISRGEADRLALGAIPGTIKRERTISDNGEVAYVYDVNYNGRVHSLTVNGTTGQVIVDRIGRKEMWPFSKF